MIYISQAYKEIDRDRIAEEIRREGFDPILISDSPGYSYPEHEHPETKLLVFLKGTMHVKVGKDSFDCRPGDKLLIPGNTRHAAWVGKDGCTFFWSEKLLG